MTETPRSRPRPLAIILAAGAIGLMAGLGAVYMKTPVEGNAGLACAAAKARADRAKPHAVGALAAFKINDRPAPATPVTFTRPDGTPARIADFKGRTVLLNLWATWCVPCREEMPALDALQGQLGGPNFEVMAVNIDTRNTDKPKTWLQDNRITRLAYYHDNSAGIFQDLKVAGRAFGMPTTLLIDAEGCEIGFLAGPADWASPEAVALVKAVTKPD